MLQEPRKTFWCLQERCKCPEKLFGVCGSPANVSANAGSLARPAQTSRQMPGYLRGLRKRLGECREPRKCLEKLFGVCGSPASLSRNFLVFAGVPQVSRETFWRLRESRKSLEKLFGVCGSSASLSRNFLVFAGVSQVSRETFWRLRKFRKRQKLLFGICGSSAGHFQKRFDPRVASVETLCRLYAFVEHTFSICVFDVVPPPKVDYNRYRSMLLS